MSDAEVIQLVAALIGAFASVAMGFEQKLLKSLRNQGATTPESAVALEGLNPISGWRLSRLLGHAVVQRAEQELFFVDEDAYRRLRRRRLRIAIPATLAAVALVFVVCRFFP